MLEQIKNIRPDIFNVTSVIDVLIVVMVLYWLVLLIKGTRAVQLIKGLIVLLLATAISNWLRLYAVHWLLNRFAGCFSARTQTGPGETGGRRASCHFFSLPQRT